MVEIIILIFCGIYLLFFTWQLFYKFKSFSFEKVDVKVEVIVCFRNEASNLPRLLNSFSALDYNVENLKFWLVNDGSEDDGVEIIKSVFSKFEYEILENEGIGKKAAFNTAMKCVSANFILTTDADCEVPRDWVHIMVSPLKNGKMLVAGFVSYFKEEKSFVSQFQQEELMALVGFSKFFADFKNPVMCNAANLAFNKILYSEALNESKYASGDDIFLLEKAKKDFPISIVYLSDSVVYTKALDNFKDIFQQKLRWAGKWSGYKDFTMKFLAPAMFVFFLCWPLSFVVLEFKWALGILAIKILVEYLYFKKMCGFVNKEVDFFYHCMISILYPLFVMLIAILSFKGKYVWKGREVR